MHSVSGRRCVASISSRRARHMAEPYHTGYIDRAPRWNDPPNPVSTYFCSFDEHSPFPFIHSSRKMAETSSQAQQSTTAVGTSLPAEPHTTETQANTDTVTGLSQVCTRLNPWWISQIPKQPNPPSPSQNTFRHGIKSRKSVLTICTGRSFRFGEHSWPRTRDLAFNFKMLEENATALRNEEEGKKILLELEYVINGLGQPPNILLPPEPGLGVNHWKPDEYQLQCWTAHRTVSPLHFSISPWFLYDLVLTWRCENWSSPSLLDRSGEASNAAFCHCALWYIVDGWSTPLTPSSASERDIPVSASWLSTMPFCLSNALCKAPGPLDVTVFAMRWPTSKTVTCTSKNVTCTHSSVHMSNPPILRQRQVYAILSDLRLSTGGYSTIAVPSNLLEIS